MKKTKRSPKASAVSRKVSSKERLDYQKKKLVGLLVLLALVILGAWIVTNGSGWDFRGWAAGKTCQNASGQGSCEKISGCSWVPNQMRQTTQSCRQRDCESGHAGCRFVKNKNGKTQCTGSYKVSTPSNAGKCIGMATDPNSMKKDGLVTCKDQQQSYDAKGNIRICKGGNWLTKQCDPNTLKCDPAYGAKGRDAYVSCDAYGQAKAIVCDVGQRCVVGRGCITLTY